MSSGIAIEYEIGNVIRTLLFERCNRDLIVSCDRALPNSFLIFASASSTPAAFAHPH